MLLHVIKLLYFNNTLDNNYHLTKFQDSQSQGADTFNTYTRSAVIGYGQTPQIFSFVTDISIAPSEFDLLLYFISNKNRVISKNALAEHISGDIADMFDNYDFVNAHIKNLKKKLSDAGCGNYLKTLYGSGYKWVYEISPE